MNSTQKTIGKEITIKGTGLHTGAPTTLTLKPAEANSGYVFVRTDIEGKPSIPANVKYVSSTDRGTALTSGDLVIHTVEHVLAALTGCDIDNCVLEINGPEMPIMDGSALPFVTAIEGAGIEDQGVEREYFIVKEPIVYKTEDGSELMAVPADDYELSVMVDYGTKVLGSQNASLSNLSDFKSEIAKCRTFSFLHELEFLLDNGLIKGGDINNAIVYVDKEIPSETVEKLKTAFGKDDVKVKANGILDNLDLHYSNEAARHKLLDVVGDLALAGMRIKGKIFATKPGHKVNTEFAKLLAEQIKAESRGPKVPDYDPSKAPLYDVNKVMELLPHRPPFLLIDKVIELSEDHVTAVKAVTMNESFFVGHFPGAPVMPGVLQVEAMAQAGGILALSTVPDPENYLTYFLKIDQVRFKHQVVPGDTLIFRLTLSEPIRRGIVQMRGETFVGNKLVNEATMMAQIVKTKK